jgi:hypothetical protein
MIFFSEEYRKLKRDCGKTSGEMVLPVLWVRFPGMYRRFLFFLKGHTSPTDLIVQ